MQNVSGVNEFQTFKERIQVGDQIALRNGFAALQDTRQGSPFDVP